MDRQLQFVHIGKCGGSTVLKLLSRSPLVSQKYSGFFETHINGVIPSKSFDYLFCIRNPIDRAFSAFEWRKKLVVLDADSTQLNRFPGEYDVLRKYDSLGDLSMNLYRENGSLNQQVAREFSLIHHLRESISFYCNPLLGVLTPGNIFGVVCQETLASDCKKLLGVGVSRVCERSNASKRRIEQDLDATAVSNLKRFFVEDYQCVTALWSLGALSDQRFWRVMTSVVEG